MADWQAGRLERIGSVDEVRITSRRKDGSLRPDVIIWAVVADGALYIRSAYGAENGWYRRLIASGSGRISGGGASAEVVPATPDAAEEDAVDEAYRAKYGTRYASIVDGMVGPAHHDVTLRLDPVG